MNDATDNDAIGNAELAGDFVDAKGESALPPLQVLRLPGLQQEIAETKGRLPRGVNILESITSGAWLVDGSNRRVELQIASFGADGLECSWLDCLKNGQNLAVPFEIGGISCLLLCVIQSQERNKDGGFTGLLQIVNAIRRPPGILNLALDLWNSGRRPSRIAGPLDELYIAPHG